MITEARTFSRKVALTYSTKHVYAVYANDAMKAVKVRADSIEHAEILGAIHFRCNASEIIARYVITQSVAVYGGGK